ncbi:MAG: glycosyltransferase family 2 protein [Phycisphaerales bacterium]|jgi:glycosyltransferase involved in cell wall biosynthesis
MTTPSTTSAFPAAGTVPVSIVILTLNEEVNMEACLKSCAWSDDVHVVDSGSKDRTVELAKAAGAKTYFHPFASFGAQRNWAIDNTSPKHEWIFHLDADERFTPELVAELGRVIASNPAEAGYHVPSKFMFMGRWLKRTVSYPTYQMRFFHKVRMRFTDWGHGQREETQGKVGKLTEPYLHYALSKGLADWMDRHNRYSTKEALQALETEREPLKLGDLFAADRVARRRALKSLFYRLPFRATLRYWLTLWVLGAIFEGDAGRTYAALMNVYERMITLKMRVLLASARQHAHGSHEYFERDLPPGSASQASPPASPPTS